VPQIQNKVRKRLLNVSGRAAVKCLTRDANKSRANRRILLP
jgi:hypothetical protein